MALSSGRHPKLRISRSFTRFRFRSSSIRSKPTSNTKETHQKFEFLSIGQDEYVDGNKVMVVVDSSPEAKGALDWALSHTIQSQDTVVLLYVTKASRQGNLKVNMQAYELLQSMKSLCQKKKPGVGVEIVLQEYSKEQGPTIVEEAKHQKVSLLILGQKKRSIFWRLIIKWWRIGKSYGGGSVDYCIQNASCMTIAVRRKGKKFGGYLITTKRHKNFWLLA